MKAQILELECITGCEDKIVVDASNKELQIHISTYEYGADVSCMPVSISKEQAKQLSNLLIEYSNSPTI